jgi:hypothetical protein
MMRNINGKKKKVALKEYKYGDDDEYRGKYWECRK